MLKGLKLLHLLGMVLFLGSIITFVLISARTEGASLQELAFARRIISAGTATLTLPGLWLLATTGLLLGFLRYGPAHAVFQTKAFIALCVIANAHLLVMPAVEEATALARQSLLQGELLAAYNDAYLRESAFGAINVLLALTAAIIAIWRPSSKVQTVS